ncbi:respiratory nitrate reductase subunit gamma [Ornithinimicrobium sp. Y1847]|uniref:respiratory nitrate reductase subunit gamma n=1 Tax=unclassified Ornithinimicrobium TaxID=2615080 RepID=UPI003B66F5DF
MNTFLWVIFPYICLAIFVVGHIWRYTYDKFGWTTRSSQLYEDKLLRIGSPLFHFGILGVAVGHFMGLVIPKSWTDRVVPEETYHQFAVIGGIIFGIMTILGLAILVYRRRATGPVFSATTVNDKVMYAVLMLVIVLGCLNTLQTAGLWVSDAQTEAHGYFNYRENVSVWFRQIFWFQPDGALMDGIPWSFRAHAFWAFVLLAMWPFTRLVHVFSAPLGYFVRPYVVYRSRDSRQGVATGTRAQKRGWERIG